MRLKKTSQKPLITIHLPMSYVCRNPCRDIPRLLWPGQKHEPIHKFIVDRQAVEEKEARFLSMALSTRGSALKVLYLYKNQISTQSLCAILLGLSTSLGAPRQLPSCLQTNRHSAGSLESLYLCVTPLPFPAIQLLSSVLRINDVLKELYLWENQLEENAIMHLAVHGIASNRTLNKFVITRNANMTGRAAAAVVVAFGRSNDSESRQNDEKQQQQQRVLNLSHNKLDGIQIRELVEPLSNVCLAKLCLDGNPIGNDGARALAEALSQNPRLLRMDLTRTRMTSTGMMVLARRGLTNNRHLRHLALLHNSTTNRRCWKTIVEVLQRSNKSIWDIELPELNATTPDDSMLRRQLDFYLTLNRSGRLQVCDDPNLDWRLFPWILAGKDIDVINYFLSNKPEICRAR